MARRNPDVPVPVINLDRDHARPRRVSEMNAHLTKFIRFSAVDGRQADLAALACDGIIKGDLSCNDGQLGCALSHIASWRGAIAENRVLTVVEVHPSSWSGRSGLIPPRRGIGNGQRRVWSGSR